MFKEKSQKSIIAISIFNLTVVIKLPDTKIDTITHIFTRILTYKSNSVKIIKLPSPFDF